MGCVTSTTIVEPALRTPSRPKRAIQHYYGHATGRRSLCTIEFVNALPHYVAPDTICDSDVGSVGDEENNDSINQPHVSPSRRREEQCPICLTSMSGQHVIALPCTHRFHSECVRSWLLLHAASCPDCRMIVSLQCFEIQPGMMMQPELLHISSPTRSLHRDAISGLEPVNLFLVPAHGIAVA